MDFGHEIVPKKPPPVLIKFGLRQALIIHLLRSQVLYRSDLIWPLINSPSPEFWDGAGPFRSSSPALSPILATEAIYFRHNA